jgi:hypothetical protein
MIQQLLDHTETPVGLVNIMIHGHFYQPERSDPFTGIIPLEPGADPYANFNERITAECYRPNAEAGNFDAMSFDLGPTLAAWLEKAHPDVYGRIIEADRRHFQRYGVGNALAQPYNHTILPLACSRDKHTQILWGLQDFWRRYGHEARGMWLAETAVNLECLDLLAQNGITYTILAPWQAVGEVDITEPYRVKLRQGRSITVFFYNDLSRAVSYDDHATTDANHFASEYRAYVNRDKEQAGTPQITVIASDGELYGHHKAWRDKFLEHFLKRSASAYGLSVCSLERYSLQHPATKEVEIHEPSSWSCGHGVRRWNKGCPCTEGEGSWKADLRYAFSRLAERGDDLFEQYAGIALLDPWAARNNYLALRHGWEEPSHFWKQHGITEHMDVAHILQARQLLEAQYYLQCAWTSCGWFFEDLDRIEPKNNIAFARRAVSLIWQATGYDLQQDLIRDLAEARSWRTGRTGADLYASLPVVPADLLPPREVLQ